MNIHGILSLAAVPCFRELKIEKTDIRLLTMIEKTGWHAAIV